MVSLVWTNPYLPEGSYPHFVDQPTPGSHAETESWEARHAMVMLQIWWWTPFDMGSLVKG